MPLQNDFIFSQSNLQDFVDCPRKFELRHIKKLQWPSLYCEPFLEFEKDLEEGQLFHHWVHQQIIGIENQPTLEQNNLNIWKSNYLVSNPLSNISSTLFPEHSLTINFCNFKLTAKYDVIAIKSEMNIMIFDWKTSHKRTPQRHLFNRVQTRVYPLVLVETGHNLFSIKTIIPEWIQMVYWFPGFPDNPEIIKYSQEQYKRDTTYITNIISEIIEMMDTNFPMTLYGKICNYCKYRSLCNRGIKAGNFQENETNEDQDENSLDSDTFFELSSEIDF